MVAIHYGIIMGTLLFHSQPNPQTLTTKISSSLEHLGATKSPNSHTLRTKVLQQVDTSLELGNEREALALVKDLQGKPNGLCCFGSARQVPQRLYTLDELKLNGIDTSSLLSPQDLTLGSIERNLQIGVGLGGFCAWRLLGFSPQELLVLALGVLFLGSVDSIAFNGGVGNLVLDTIGHTLSKKYHNRVVQHEAGHFLIAYLLGVLPRGYTLTSLEALQKEGSLNVQAGTAFVDFEFLEEVNAGKLSSKMLDRFSCIALAGVATEYLLFGYSEGGLADIYKKARSKLAEAMSSGKSVGFCIDTIEEAIDTTDL
ncbi:hypothetical protein Scep_009166 [Stephania cephalantha]|uniref:Uncharacterized protein n=1 Tax=Stephania cephalantha TaxID=152367 RepID=A0AAP0JUZ4_9MAGN